MKNYLIIGASSGIGLAVANEMALSGNRVFGTFATHPMESNQKNMSYHPLNSLDQEINIDFLPEVLDGFVYCPGSIQLKPFERIQIAVFMEDYQLQVLGAIKLLQLVLPRLKKSTQGAVLFYSTLAVQKGLPFHSLVASSKGAIEGLTKSLAAELAPGIRVNAIAPSLTDTRLAAGLLNTDQKKEANALRHPLKRFGKPEDIAAMSVFLLSEKASWITGQIMHVDGGLSSLS